MIELKILNREGDAIVTARSLQQISELFNDSRILREDVAMLFVFLTEHYFRFSYQGNEYTLNEGKLDRNINRITYVPLEESKLEDMIKDHKKALKL